jgi:hypothetical protein
MQSTQIINQTLQGSDSRNLYEILGIEKNADSEQIAKAYRKLALIYHPDKGGDAEKFKVIAHAYSVLNNEKHRKQYDAIIDDALAEREFRATSLHVFRDEKSVDICINLGKAPPVFEDMFLNPSKQKFFTGKDVITPVLRPLKKGEILYMVGNAIPFSTAKKAFRGSIPEQEIINSFPAEGKIMLFRLELMAHEYSRFNRLGNFYSDKISSQSAVAKIEILRDLDAELKGKGLNYREEYKSQKEVSFNHFDYLEVDAKDILPLVARLSILSFVGEKQYPLITFSKSNKRDSAVNTREDSEILMDHRPCTIS